MTKFLAKLPSRNIRAAHIFPRIFPSIFPSTLYNHMSFNARTKLFFFHSLQSYFFQRSQLFFLHSSRRCCWELRAKQNNDDRPHRKQCERKPRVRQYSYCSKRIDWSDYLSKEWRRALLYTQIAVARENSRKSPTEGARNVLLNCDHT